MVEGMGLKSVYEPELTDRTSTTAELGTLESNLDYFISLFKLSLILGNYYESS